MTRIVMITDGAFSDRIRVSNEARALAEAGCEVEVHALDAWCASRTFDWHGVRVHEHRMPRWTHWARVLNAELPFFAWAVSRVLKPVMQGCRADVIHVHNLFVWKGARRAVASTKPSSLQGSSPRWVLDVAENLPEIMQEYDHVKRGLGRVLIRPRAWARLQQQAMAEADHVVLVTPTAVEDYVQRLGLPRSKAISCNNVPWQDHIGMDGLAQLQARFKDDFVILYFGDTSRRRGTDLAIRAMPQIVERIPNAQLVVVGKNNREDVFLAQLREESSVQHRIHLEGFQPLARLGSYLNVAHIGISPLVRNVHHGTTHANKLFQFMHGGLPLVVSDCPAQAALVKETSTGLVHRAGDVTSFAEAVISLGLDPQMARTMGQRGKQAVAEVFRWDVEISRYVKAVSHDGSVAGL